jgi:hypothetical protein
MSLDELEREMREHPLRVGDRVAARIGGWTGTVERVRTGRTPGSRYTIVRWDANGLTGRCTRAALRWLPSTTETGETR